MDIEQISIAAHKLSIAIEPEWIDLDSNGSRNSIASLGFSLLRMSRDVNKYQLIVRLASRMNSINDKKIMPDGNYKF